MQECFDFADDGEYLAVELECDVDLLLGPVPSTFSTQQQQQRNEDQDDEQGISHRVLTGVATSSELARSRFFTINVWLSAIPEDNLPLASLDVVLKHPHLPRKFLDALLLRMRAWFQPSQEALCLVERCVKQGTKRPPQEFQTMVNTLFNAFPPHIAAEIELVLCRAAAARE